MMEAVAMVEVLTTHVRSENNPSDICTKVMHGGAKQDNCTHQVLCNTLWTEWVTKSQGLLAPMPNYLPHINGRFNDPFGGKYYLNEGTILIHLSVNQIFVWA